MELGGAQRKVGGGAQGRAGAGGAWDGAQGKYGEGLREKSRLGLREGPWERAQVLYFILEILFGDFLCRPQPCIH